MAKLLLKNLFSIVVLAACLAPQVGWALDGDPAPPLNIGQWLQGESVKIKPGTNVYVVEIWNSTSAGSRSAITNLNNLQKRYEDKGLVVIGISDEPLVTLKKFLTNTPTKIQYRIALDNKRYTSLTYMNPVMQRGIPYAFVVGTNGDLLWHGSPLGGLTAAVDIIMTGKYDEALAQKNDLENHQLKQYLALARQGSDRAKMAGQSLLYSRTNDVDKLCELAYQISAAPNLMTRDFGLAGLALDQAEKLAPTNSVEVAIARAIWLFESGKQDAGLAEATQALAYSQDPTQKTNIEICIQTMKKRQAAKGSHPGNPKPAASAGSGQDSDFYSNQNPSGGAGQGSSAAGKP